MQHLLTLFYSVLLHQLATPPFSLTRSRVKVAATVEDWDEKNNLISVFLSVRMMLSDYAVIQLGTLVSSEQHIKAPH